MKLDEAKSVAAWMARRAFAGLLTGD